MDINHYDFTEHLIKSAYESKELDETNYHRLMGMLLDSEDEDLDELIAINLEYVEALKDHKRQKISERLVIGAEKIEATEDPKEKARLMIHYNNLLKELGA
jgi:CDP-glycerol glycerophosphotransferase (TagB/SpsB family)